MNKDKLIVFLDSVNRTIAGIFHSEEVDSIVVKNPVIINAVPKANGQMMMQLIPVFFREILRNKNQECLFTYQKDKIVMSNISEMEMQIETEYNNLFKPIDVLPIAPSASDDVVIDLFGDKKNV